MVRINLYRIELKSRYASYEVRQVDNSGIHIMVGSFALLAMLQNIHTTTVPLSWSTSCKGQHSFSIIYFIF